MSRVMPITGALAAMLASAPGAVAQVTPGQDSGGSAWPTVGRDPGFGRGTGTDSAFIQQVIRGNVTEVALSRLADSRADDSGVEEFAERMISEHNSMTIRWNALARKSEVKVDEEVGPAGEQSIERLEDLSGAEFDQAYMAEMIRRHEQDLATFQRIAASAKSSVTRELANSGVPTIQEHLALARQIGSRVGVSTTAGRAGGVTNPVPTPSDDARRRTTTDRETGDERADRDDRPPLPAEDRGFVREVVGDHLMHIRLAKRAQREAKRDETRELAERIEKEFTEWQERWENLADRRDLDVPSHLERVDRQKIERLEGASERGFDRTYLAILANHLESVVDRFRKEREEARSVAVRGMVEKELPVIRDVLARARRLQKQAEERAEASDRK